MTGTDKQVKWAEDIKANAIKVCDNGIELGSKHPGDLAEDGECYKIVRTALENLFASEKMQNAAFVIENRDRLPNANNIVNRARLLKSKNGTNVIDECKKLCGIK